MRTFSDFLGPSCSSSLDSDVAHGGEGSARRLGPKLRLVLICNNEDYECTAAWAEASSVAMALYFPVLPVQCGQYRPVSLFGRSEFTLGNLAPCNDHFQPTPRGVLHTTGSWMAVSE